MRWYVALQAGLTEAEEQRFCRGFSLNIAVSTDDAMRLRQIAPGSKVAVVPNGVDTTAFQPDNDADAQGVVFVGGHGWYPNRDAMEYFAKDILPLIRDRVGDVSVTWVGRAPDDVISHYRQVHDVCLTGYV